MKAPKELLIRPKGRSPQKLVSVCRHADMNREEADLREGGGKSAKNTRKMGKYLKIEKTDLGLP